MGLFDIFNNSELKDRIAILEIENKKLANDIQINQEKYSRELEEYRKNIEEKEKIILKHQKKINDLEIENSKYKTLVSLHANPCKSVKAFEDGIYDGPIELNEYFTVGDLFVEYDCEEEVCSVFFELYNNSPWKLRVWLKDVNIENHGGEVERLSIRNQLCEVEPGEHNDIDFHIHQTELDQILEPYHDEIDYYDFDECLKQLCYTLEFDCENFIIGICQFEISDTCINIVNYDEEDDEEGLDDIRCMSGDVLYIYKGNIRCHRYGHHIIQATAVLHNKTDNEIELNVEYCTDCRKFFLDYTVFEQYRNRYGVLVGNFRMVVNGEFDGEYDLAEESPLMLSGYNVSQRDGYTYQERHYILARIIHDGIMDKGDVIRYLSYFIRKNGAKRGNELALSKWEEDLAFVQEYDKSTQPRVIISDIKKY